MMSLTMVIRAVFFNAILSKMVFCDKMGLVFLPLVAMAIPPPLTSNNDGFFLLDPANFGSHLRDDLAWATQNVPFVDVEDDDVLTAYYYRWRSYKKHISQDPQTKRYVVTEFLPRVPWAGKDNTIPAAAGHHIMEGRWIHDEVSPRILFNPASRWGRCDHVTPQAILNDYITF